MEDNTVLTKPLVPKNASHPKRPIKEQASWQERLLPTMSGLLIGMSIFFFITTFGQMAYLHWTILQQPTVEINSFAGLESIGSSETFSERMNARELEVRSRMEAFLITQRYHQANVQLMAGLWTRYLGFITGMILALVGASFVLGKLREPAQKFDGKFPLMGLSLQTTSPGVILTVLGVLLMYATITDRDTYRFTDVNTYLFPVETVFAPQAAYLPTPMSPEQMLITPEPTSKP